MIAERSGENAGCSLRPSMLLDFQPRPLRLALTFPCGSSTPNASAICGPMRRRCAFGVLAAPRNSWAVTSPSTALPRVSGLRLRWATWPRAHRARAVDALPQRRTQDGDAGVARHPPAGPAPGPLDGGRFIWAAGADLSMLRGVEALNHTSIRIAVFSLDGAELLMRNPAAAVNFGDAPPESGKTEFSRLFVHEHDAESVLTRLREGEACRMEAELRTQGGARWHLLDARPMRDPVTGADVMQLNARHRRPQGQPGGAGGARQGGGVGQPGQEQLLANMSHEIRTPMNGVLGLTELVLRTELTDRQRQFIQMAHDSARGLMTIINDLLDVAKIDAGRIVIEREPFSLHDCVSEALQPLVLQAQGKGLAPARLHRT